MKKPKRTKVTVTLTFSLLEAKSESGRAQFEFGHDGFLAWVRFSMRVTDQY